MILLLVLMLLLCRGVAVVYHDFLCEELAKTIHAFLVDGGGRGLPGKDFFRVRCG